MPGSRLLVADPDEGTEEETPVKAPHQAAAVHLLIERLEYLLGLPNIAVVGHRLSAQDASVAIHVIPTDEELIIARSAIELVALPRAATGPSS